MDGVGKTTQVQLLADRNPDRMSPVVCRLPSGTPVGETLRAMLKDPAVEMQQPAELLLMAATYAELDSTIIYPAQKAGRHVVCDRLVRCSSFC